MRVVSVNVGEPREALSGGVAVLTAIFKQPVEGRVAIRGNNLEGDWQADLSVHGGTHKAVYLYPSEHYGYWREQLPEMDLPFGMFGENLTTAGLDEESVNIGDVFRFGSTVLQVTQPRMPCFKLGIRFGRADMVKKFWKSGFSGIYFSVKAEGDVGAGDSIEKVSDGPERISVADLVRLYRGIEKDPAVLERALKAPLYGGWKEGLRTRAR